MKLHNVTGVNRGLLTFAKEAMARGGRKVYTAARSPASITLPGLEAIQLDVTSGEDVAAAVRRCGDVTILINNAGIATTGGFLPEGSIEAARTQLETNFFGPLRLSQAFAFDVPKTSPEGVASRTLDALEAGAEEVLADEASRQLKQGLSAEPGVYLMAPA